MKNFNALEKQAILYLKAKCENESRYYALGELAHGFVAYMDKGFSPDNPKWKEFLSEIYERAIGQDLIDMIESDSIKLFQYNGGEKE